MINRLFQWIVAISLAIGAPVAKTQAVFNLETASGEQSFCKDIPLKVDDNSGWITNPQLEYGFRYLLITAGKISLGSIFVDGIFLTNQSADYMAVEGVDNRNVTIHIIRGFLFFEHNESRKISGFQIAGLMASVDSLEQMLTINKAKAIAVEEWLISLHWDVVHPFWHGKGARKIVVLVHEPSQRNSLDPEPTGQGAQCEALGIEIQLQRVEIST